MNHHSQSAIPSAEAPAMASHGEPAAGSMEFTRFRDNPYLCAKILRFVLNFLEQDNGSLDDCDFFVFIVRTLGREATIKLARKSCPLDGLTRRTQNHLEAGQGVPQNILSELWSESQTRPLVKKALLAALTKKRGQLERAAAATADKNVLQHRFAEMVRLFGLDECESNLLLLAYASYAEIWRWTEIGVGRSDPSAFQRLWLMCQALGIPVALGGKYLHKTGRLRSFGCLDNDLEFNSDLEPFLVGLTDQPLASKYFVRCADPALPWAMHGKLVEQHGALLKALISRRDPDRGLNILFHGTPGAGKTSFARSLAAELGLDLYRIRVSEEFESDAGGARPRFAALRICDGQVHHGRSLILIDEADEMLGGSGGALFELLSERTEGLTGKKDSLNTILDQLKTPCLWITNIPPGRLAASSRRRFDYSIEFKPLSPQQRCQVWMNLRSQYRLQEVLDDDLVEHLARRFPVSAGGVDLALRNYARLRGDGSGTPGVAVDTLVRLLTPHCELMGVAPDGTAAHVAGGYSLAGLNVRGQTSPERIVQAVRKFRQWQEQSVAAGDKNNLYASRLTMLLSGPPGTGKTEFVKFLGRELDCPVQTCMAGDLLSRYVGDTEQNIRAVFRTAAEDKAILFIDEADGMFRSRALAETSWEVTQVSELLHAMENFHGLLACATNGVETLDPATIRRFIFKLEFDYLDAAGKLAFYHRVFSELCPEPLAEPAKRRLTNIADLTPGDFHTVRQAMFYLAGVDGHAATHNELLAGLEQESRAKRQSKSGSAGNFGFGKHGERDDERCRPANGR